MQDGDDERLLQLALFEARSLDNEVVSLPLARRTRGVHHWHVLTVHRARLTVGIGAIAVRVQHLEFVDPREEDAAIPPRLALGLGHVGDVELDVELDTAELAGGPDRPGTRRAAGSRAANCADGPKKPSLLISRS